MVLKHKLTLLGPETKIGNKIIYFGPLHYYLMAPALAVSRFDPIGPYYWTALLGVATVLLIYFTNRSLISAAFYAVFPLAVIYNRWAWNPNTIPLFAAGFLLAFFRKKYFLAGIFGGLAFQLHITTIALAPLLIFAGGRKNIAKILGGFLVGIAPLLIFDLRHNFLYLRGYWGLLQADTAYRGFNFHYFLALLPVLALLLSKLDRKIGLAAVSGSLVMSLLWLGRQVPQPAVNPANIRRLCALVAADQKNGLNFNIASFTDSDTRATSYRYFLELAGTNPLGVGEYAVADHLYVTSFAEPAEVLYNRTYEVAAFKPVRVSRSWKLGKLNLYRLEYK